MIIDFHTHMFPDKIAKGTLDFLEGICKVTPYTNGTDVYKRQVHDDRGASEQGNRQKRT